MRTTALFNRAMNDLLNVTLHGGLPFDNNADSRFLVYYTKLLNGNHKAEAYSLLRTFFYFISAETLGYLDSFNLIIKESDFK